LLDADQRVASTIVRCGPFGVPRSRVELRDVRTQPVCRILFAADDAPHLVDARLGRVVAALHERAKEGEPLDGHQELAEPDVSGHRPTVPARPAARV